MRLEEYIKERGITKTEFSRRCGVSIATVFNIIRGKNISLEVALKIVAYTEGKVQPHELMPLEREKKLSRKKIK